MTYTFKGKLWDKTENSFEPISNVLIKLYTPQNTLGAPQKNYNPTLIAESKTDADGNFIIEINGKYSKGQELQVDILCEKVPGSTNLSDAYEKINFKSLTINPGRSKLKMESFRMGTITFLSIFSAA
ncbi:MAG TPA: hypothetical protein VD908_00745 [Cytophagales bacterium]|nr:hypothetical protein [Cytophagales bacterium]